MKTKSKALAVIALILVSLLGFYLYSDDVLIGPSAFEDKQYDKRYEFKVLNMFNKMTDRTYSLPSQCEKLVKDLEHTHDHHATGSMTRIYATWDRKCGFYMDNKDKINQSVKHDYVASIDFYSLPLDEFPFPCGISQNIFNEESWNTCLNSMKAGKTIMDELATRLEGGLVTENVFLKETMLVDKATCRFMNGEGPDGIYYDESEKKIYCGNPVSDEKYKYHSVSHSISAPPFSDVLAFADYNSDGYMDAALTYAGSSCSGTACGGAGVVILTKKSKEGRLERILFD